MNSSFSVGEVAIFCRPGSPNYGKEVTITGPLKQTSSADPDDNAAYGMQWCHPIAPPSWSGVYRPWRVCVPLMWLRKKRPPEDDTNTVSTWEKCVWKPTNQKA